MRSFSVRMTESAVCDIQDIAQYIRFHLLEPETAKNQIARIRKSILSLSDFPERNALISDGYLQKKQIRFMHVDNFLIFYTVHKDKSMVYIVRVVYSRRDWQIILESSPL